MKRSELEKMLRQDIENAAPSDFEGLMAGCDTTPATESVAVRAAEPVTAGAPAPRRRVDHRHLIAVTAILLAMALLLPLLLLRNTGSPEPLTPPTFRRGSIVIDINPSLELCYDENGTVTEAVALNRDAEVLLYELSLVGKSYEAAIDAIFARCLQLGFFAADRDDNAVLTSAITESGSSDTAMTEAVKQYFSKTFTAERIRGVVITGAESPELAAGAAQYGITPQKYALILSCEALDDSVLAEEEYANVSIRELHARIEATEKKRAENSIKLLEEQWERLLEELSELIENLIEDLANRIEDLHEAGTPALPERRSTPQSERDEAFYENALDRLEDMAEEIENAADSQGVIDAINRILAELEALEQGENDPLLLGQIRLTALKITALLEIYSSLDAETDALTSTPEEIYRERLSKFEPSNRDDGDKDDDYDRWQKENANSAAAAWNENKKNWKNNREKD